MDENCTVYNAAELIGKKWTLLIILEIYRGKNSSRRYSELKSGIPAIGTKILSERLKELEKDGIVDKRIDTGCVPIKCEYSLTKSGLGLVDVVKRIKSWSLEYRHANRVCLGTNCKSCKI